MKVIDALNTLSISEREITLETVKKAYRKACKTFHPDINPAGIEIMKVVNEAHETLLKENFPIFVGEKEKFSNYGEVLNDALTSIVTLTDINIEICGSWVWVSGNTKPSKEIFKKSGFLWSNKKEMWYFRPESEKKRFFRGSSSIEEIRTKYGSEKIRTQRPYALKHHY